MKFPLSASRLSAFTAGVPEPLTPEEQQEAAMAAGETLGLSKRPTVEQIAVLTRQLDHLHSEQETLCSRMSTLDGAALAAASEEMFRLRKDIAQAEQLLASYRAQHEGRN